MRKQPQNTRLNPTPMDARTKTPTHLYWSRTGLLSYMLLIQKWPRSEFDATPPANKMRTHSSLSDLSVFFLKTDSIADSSHHAVYCLKRVLIHKASDFWF